MKRAIAFAFCITLSIITFSQEKTKLMGISLRYTGSNYNQTLSAQSTAISYLRSSFPSSWSAPPTSSGSYYGVNPQSGGSLGINLRLGHSSENPRFSTYLELGISWYDRSDAFYFEYNDSLIGTSSYQTPIGTLHSDTTFHKSRSLEHYTNILGVYGEFRVYSAKSHWLKGYLGTNLTVGTAINSVVSSREYESISTQVRLGTQPVEGGHYWDYGLGGSTFDHKSGPHYLLARLGIPVGLEARIGKPENNAGQFVIFVQGEAGLDATTGPFGNLTFYSALSFGLRYHL